jgi:hypothetical protein
MAGGPVLDRPHRTGTVVVERTCSRMIQSLHVNDAAMHRHQAWRGAACYAVAPNRLEYRLAVMKYSNAMIDMYTIGIVLSSTRAAAICCARSMTAPAA